MITNADRKPTAQELADQSRGMEPLQIAGKPATQCPKCGCVQFTVHTVRRGVTRITRKVNCRNCGAKYETTQDMPRFTREIE